MHTYKMPNGQWRVVVQDNGHRITKVAATEREAKRAGADLLLELGKLPDANGATVGDLIDLHIAGSNLARTTMDDRVSLIGKIPDWMKAWKVQQVDAMMVELALKRLIDDGTLTPHRAHKLHGLLSGSFKRAARWGWVKSNPVASVPAPALVGPVMVVPSPAEVDRLVRYAMDTNVEVGTALHLVSRTGIRRGELCGLQWTDLREPVGELVVQRAVSSTTGHGRHEKDIKTGAKGNRVITLGKTTLRTLKTHRARQLETALERRLPPPRWMFTHDGVEPWRADYITTALRRIASDDPDGIHINQLRHFAATQWIAGGIDIKTVSYLLGHAKASTTMDIYAAFLPGRGRDAADVMERLFGG